MKLHVVHDRAGKIVCAVHLRAENHGGPRPVAGKGQYETVLEVPHEHRGMGFLEICRRLHVDLKTKNLVLPRKSVVKTRK